MDNNDHHHIQSTKNFEVDPKMVNVSMEFSQDPKEALIYFMPEREIPQYKKQLVTKGDFDASDHLIYNCYNNSSYAQNIQNKKGNSSSYANIENEKINLEVEEIPMKKLQNYQKVMAELEHDQHKDLDEETARILATFFRWPGIL